MVTRTTVRAVRGNCNVVKTNSYLNQSHTQGTVKGDKDILHSYFDKIYFWQNVFSYFTKKIDF